MPMPDHRSSYRSADRASPAPRYDVPILAFMGAWMLVLSWDIGGANGLVFPGGIGWTMVLIALLRFATNPHLAGPRASRAMAGLWLGCALVFLLIVGAELFLGRGMPQSWRDAAVEALHIRRVDRSYAP
ncbi:hypothetical protein [Inquilinus sp.]|uniref:hypothetical protein n=1 Tax=Inquilinus sp. TaxID=1932117 RepID=UPI0031DA9AA2